MARSKRALGGVGRFRAARAARREGRSRERGPSGARRPVRGMRAGSPVAPRQPGPVARRSPLRPRRRQRRGRSVGAGGVAGGVGAGGLHALGAGRGSRAGDTGRAAGEDGCASLADGARVRGGPRDGLTRGRARRQRARACRLCALARGAGVVWRGSRRDRGAFVRRAARRCDVALRRGRRARAWSGGRRSRSSRRRAKRSTPRAPSTSGPTRAASSSTTRGSLRPPGAFTSTTRSSDSLRSFARPRCPPSGALSSWGARAPSARYSPRGCSSRRATTSALRPGDFTRWCSAPRAPSLRSRSFTCSRSRLRRCRFGCMPSCQ